MRVGAEVGVAWDWQAAATLPMLPNTANFNI
jgi:hypothetical protein